MNSQNLGVLVLFATMIACGCVGPPCALEIRCVSLNLRHSDSYIPTGAAFFGMFGTADPTNDFSKGSSQI